MWERLLNRLGDLLFLMRDRAERLRRDGSGAERSRPPRAKAIKSTLGAAPRRLARAVKDRPIPAALLLLSLAVLVTAVTVASSNGRRRPSPPRRAHFFDTQTRKLFEAPFDTASPSSAPSGGVGVRAYVSACGSCAAADRRFISYLAKQMGPASAQPPRNKRASPEGSGLGREGRTMQQYGDALREAQVVASADAPDRWVPLGSEEGQGIVQAGKRKCDQPIVPCEP